jgi:LysM repeat protein
MVPGEDLQSIASRTGVSVPQLQAFNNGVDLKSTTKLVVPFSGINLTSNRRRAASASDETPSASLTKTRARKGDTIAKIAAAHKLDAGDLARLNGLPADGELQVGQEIKLPASMVAPAPARHRRHH